MVVRWAVSPPPDALLFQCLEVDGLTLRLVTVTGLSMQLSAGLVRLESVPPGLVQISRFVGYSQNAVPGFGFEPGFLLRLDGSLLGLQESSNQLTASQAGAAAVFNFLYESGPRDTAANSAFRLVARTSAGPRYLGYGSTPGSESGVRRAALVRDPGAAAVCFARSLLETDDGRYTSFSVGVVGSSWTLSSDYDLALVFGQPSETQALVTVFARVDGSLRLDGVPQLWTVQRGVSQFGIPANLVLSQIVLSQTSSAVAFALEPVPAARLFLAWNNSNLGLQGSVGVMSPHALRAESSPDALVPSFPADSVAGLSNAAGVRPAASDNWFPVLQPLVPAAVPSTSTFEAYVSWVSGSSEYFLSARSGPQTERRTLQLWPMNLDAICLVDTGAVVPGCGALQPRLLESNTGAFPMYAAQKLLNASACQSLFAQSLTQNDSEGFVWVFSNNTCSTQQPGFLRLASTDILGPVSMNVQAVVVPENLTLTLQQQNGPGLLRLRPGLYTAASLVAADRFWPPGVVTFVAECSTLGPRSFYIAKACMGSAATESQVWKPGQADCNSFFDAQCPAGPLKNASECGCYLDQAWIQSLGLGETGAKMVTAPQCWGRVCPLGSAYRKQIWTNGCGRICSQTVIGGGRDWRQAGVQEIRCSGQNYNTVPAQEAAPPPQQELSDTWVAAVVAAGLLAVLFLALFLTLGLRNAKAKLQEDTRGAEIAT